MSLLPLIAALRGSSSGEEPPPEPGTGMEGNGYGDGVGPVTVAAGSDPTELTWTKEYEQRFLKPIDLNHVYYTSNFSSSTSDLSAASGSTPSISGGNLVIGGSCVYQSLTSPTASWWSIEMIIADMTSGGSSQKLGPALADDASNYIAGIYDKVAGKLQIIQNGSVRVEVTETLNTTNLGLILMSTGYGLTLWKKENGETDYTFMCYVPNQYDFLEDATGTNTNYKIGLYCSQSGATVTHNVSSLKGAASGGAGIFNNRLVVNENGSPYIWNGKFLMTGDLAAIYNNTEAYTSANSCLFAFDPESPEDIEIVGRFYFHRKNMDGTGVYHRFGGQNLKLLYDYTISKWIMSYTPVEATGGLESNDVYVLLDYDEVFGERVIEDTELNTIGFGESGAYDVNFRKFSGTYYGPVTKTFGAGRPRLYSGSSLSSLSVAASYDNGTFYECPVFARLNNTDRILYCTFGDTKIRAFTFPGLSSLGDLDLPFTTSSRIPAYDWLCKQSGGITEYYLVGFDTQEATLTDADGGSVTYPWAIGRLVIYKANETSTGYEFP